eukprot:GHVN01017736.1.p1 GENE.GHVN01017736.1~~GHVN01017736.1.p1  ORF type:complete len:130 (-),score=8.01 GHVN01017736.1:243-632(-)
MLNILIKIPSKNLLNRNKLNGIYKFIGIFYVTWFISVTPTGARLVVMYPPKLQGASCNTIFAPFSLNLTTAKVPHVEGRLAYIEEGCDAEPRKIVESLQLLVKPDITNWTIGHRSVHSPRTSSCVVAMV